MPVQRGESVRVVGLSEFLADLKAMDWDTDVLTKAAKEAATMVLKAAQSMAGSEGGVAAHAAKSMRASAGRKSASILLGGGDHPEAAGAEFGSIRFHQFKPYRGNSSGAGYFLYPSIRARTDEVVQIFSTAVERLISRAFPD